MSIYTEGIFVNGTKFCKKCNLRRSIEDFPVSRKGHTSRYCVTCFTSIVREVKPISDRRGTIFYHIKALFLSARQRTEKSKYKAANVNNYEGVIQFDITENYLYSIYESQRGKCALSGREMTLGKPENGFPDKNAMSLDRIIPLLGYVKGNVRFVTHQVNMAKGMYNDEDLIQLVFDITAHQKYLDKARTVAP